MTAAEVYDLTTHGGATEFACLIQACESLGPYCLIDDMAVNCYVEPVYTLAAGLVVAASALSPLASYLEGLGFRTETHPHAVNAQGPESDLRIQFTTDGRYQEFLARAETHTVLGIAANVACLEDVTRGRLWAYADARRRLSKHKKDELDLIRLGEKFPHSLPMYPAELRDLIQRGRG